MQVRSNSIDRFLLILDINTLKHFKIMAHHTVQIGLSYQREQCIISHYVMDRQTQNKIQKMEISLVQELAVITRSRKKKINADGKRVWMSGEHRQRRFSTLQQELEVSF